MTSYYSDSDSCPSLSVYSPPRTSTSTSSSRDSSPSTNSSSSTDSSSTNPSSWLSLQSDIDRSLRVFDTKIDVSCFEDLEDQLLVSPRESFADLCYSDAVDTNPANDPDWCIFVNTPRRMNWDRTDNSVHESETDEFGFLNRSLNIDPYAKPDGPGIDSFTTSSCTSEYTDCGYAFPFLYGDSMSAMTIPDPNYTIHYSPSPVARQKQPNRWDRTVTRLTSFARTRF